MRELSSHATCPTNLLLVRCFVYLTTKLAAGVFCWSRALIVVECTVPMNQPLMSSLSQPTNKHQLTYQLLAICSTLQVGASLRELEATRQRASVHRLCLSAPFPAHGSSVVVLGEVAIVFGLMPRRKGVR